MTATERMDLPDSTELVEAFDHLATQLSAFSASLRELSPRCWVAMSDDEESLDPLTKAATYYQDIWYKGEQDGRETRSCYGFVMASPALIEQAGQVNDAKDKFKSLVQRYQKNDKDRWLACKAQLNKRHQTLRERMYYTGLARLHLKQAYRHIPVLPACPQKIGFTWYSNGRSIKKITTEEAESRLLAMGEDKSHIQVQLQKLYTLPPDEILARIQTQVPLVRANLVYKTLNDRGIAETTRKAMNVSLPLLIPENDAGTLPVFNQISHEPPAERTRIPRNDFRIEDDVFLPSLRAHRYRSA